MSVDSVLAAEQRGDQRLIWHLWVAILCGVLFVTVLGGLISRQSNPMASQLTQSTGLTPVTGQIERVETDACAYRASAVFGMGGQCGGGVRMWLAGMSKPVLATTRAAPYLQPSMIRPGGYVMAMVAPDGEAHMLSVDAATIVQYGAMPAPDSSNDFALVFLFAAPMLLYPVHLMMRQAARGRALRQTAAGATWGR